MATGIVILIESGETPYIWAPGSSPRPVFPIDSQGILHRVDAVQEWYPTLPTKLYQRDYQTELSGCVIM